MMGVCITRLRKDNSIYAEARSSSYYAQTDVYAVRQSNQCNDFVASRFQNDLISSEEFGNRNLHNSNSENGSVLYSTIDSSRQFLPEYRSASIASYPHYTDIIVREAPSLQQRLRLLANNNNIGRRIQTNSDNCSNIYNLCSRSESELYAEISNVPIEHFECPNHRPFNVCDYYSSNSGPCDEHFDGGSTIYGSIVGPDGETTQHDVNNTDNQCHVHNNFRTVLYEPPSTVFEHPEEEKF